MRIDIKHNPRFVIELDSTELVHLKDVLTQVDKTKIHEDTEDFIDKLLKHIGYAKTKSLPP